MHFNLTPKKLRFSYGLISGSRTKLNSLISGFEIHLGSGFFFKSNRFCKVRFLLSLRILLGWQATERWFIVGLCRFGYCILNHQWFQTATRNDICAIFSIAGSVRSIPGLWQIVSLSGLYLPHCSSLSLSVADSQGKVISGRVDGILWAAGPVKIVVGSCVDPSLHRVRPISVSGEEGSGNTSYPSGFPQPTWPGFAQVIYAYNHSVCTGV